MIHGIPSVFPYLMMGMLIVSEPCSLNLEDKQLFLCAYQIKLLVNESSTAAPFFLFLFFH